MHDHHLARSVLESIIAKTADLPRFKRVVSFKIAIGKLKMVSPTSFREAFSQAAEGTPCAGARADVRLCDGSDVRVEDIEAEFSD